MGKKNLALIIEANQGYIRNTDKNKNFSAQNNILFSAMTQTYIPLLNMMNRLRDEKISFKIGLVLCPAICESFSDEEIINQYIEHLDNLITLGKKEIARCKKNEYIDQAQSCLDHIEKTKTDFTEKYSSDLLSAFKSLAKDDYIELIPTAATYAYLPHYADFIEALNAQVETGLFSHKHFFGSAGEGFWIPHAAWDRNLEWVIRSYGVNYTILDARSILFAKKAPETGIFTPVRCRNSLVVFGKDPDIDEEIFGEEGFCKNQCYRWQERDIGFDLPQKEIASFFGKNDARIETGFKYWAIADEDEENLVPYNKDEAAEQTVKDALSFYENKNERLEKACELLDGKDASLVCVINARMLGQKWHEGIQWLENVIRCIDSKKGFELAHCKDLIANQFELEKIEPYPCSSNGLGYGEDMLSNANSWMIRYTRKATERMIDLADRFPSESSLKERLLNMAAKQVLLAQSGNWQEMINEGNMPDFVEGQFKDEILSFTKVFDSLASNTVSTEWLTGCEQKNKIFPWLNYRIFARKH